MFFVLYESMYDDSTDKKTFKNKKKPVTPIDILLNVNLLLWLDDCL